jgi:hypothetical protein
LQQIKKHLTYANVMSSLAVFLVLGGGAAFAANQLGKNSVGSKQLKKNAVTAAKIKRNAVTTAKIRNRAVTGAKIDLATLGTVPSATHAGVADSAGNAGNANTVGGQSVVKVFKTMSAGQTDVSIAALGGFNFVASCEATDVDIEVEGPSGPGFAMEAGGTSGDGALTGAYESSKPGEGGSILVDDLFAGSDAGFGVSNFYGVTTPGTVVSGILGYDFETFFKTPPNTCVVSGHLTVG